MDSEKEPFIPANGVDGESNSSDGDGEVQLRSPRWHTARWRLFLVLNWLLVAGNILYFSLVLYDVVRVKSYCPVEPLSK